MKNKYLQKLELRTLGLELIRPTQKGSDARVAEHDVLAFIKMEELPLLEPLHETYQHKAQTSFFQMNVSENKSSVVGLAHPERIDGWHCLILLKMDIKILQRKAAL